MVNLQGKRRSTKDNVVDYLLDSVLEKKLVPGDKIVETQVARDLGLSQGVVREAFREMAYMGFFISEPFKGTHLRHFTNSDRDDYYEVRTFIESTAISWARKRGLLDTEGALDRIMQNSMRILSFSEEGDHRNQIIADLDFHRNLVALAGSPSLVRSWDALGNFYWFFIHYFSGMDMRSEAEKHLLLLNSLRNKDFSRVEELLKIHFDKNRKIDLYGVTSLEDRQ